MVYYVKLRPENDPPPSVEWRLTSHLLDQRPRLLSVKLQSFIQNYFAPVWDNILLKIDLPRQTKIILESGIILIRDV